MITAEQRAEIVAEARSWLGTPYHHCADLKGVGGGVDCLLLLVRVFHAVGLIPDIDPRPYTPQWHLHRSEELYLAGLEAYGRELALHEDPQPGDIGIWRFGRTFSHAGILLNEREVLHALATAHQVTITDRWAPPLAARVVRYFTVTGQ